jgi:hypothetical protein
MCQERRLAQLAEMEEMNKINKRLTMKGVNADLLAKQKLLLDMDVDWVDMVAIKPTPTGAALTLSFVKGVQLPKDEFKRQLQVKSIARVLDAPDPVPDVNASDSDPVVAAALLATESAIKPGLVEVNIDEVRRILRMRADIIEEGENDSLVDSSVLWETQDLRYRRIQLGGVEDEATCVVNVSHLHLTYN